jgi:hypothetical protein
MLLPAPHQTTARAVPLLGSTPVTGLDDEADSLIGYRSPVHGRRPEVQGAADRGEELELLTERIRSWLASGIEPNAIGVPARSAYLVRQASEALAAAGMPTTKPMRSRAIRICCRNGAYCSWRGRGHAIICTSRTQASPARSCLL